MSRRARSTERSGARLPLSLRLPNAPAFFVGRQAETDRLEQAIGRAAASVVWGLGGLGKTTLVLHTLHQRFATQVPRTIMVGLTGSAPIYLEVAKALAAVDGGARVGVQADGGAAWRAIEEWLRARSSSRRRHRRCAVTSASSRSRPFCPPPPPPVAPEPHGLLRCGQWALRSRPQSFCSH